MNNEQLPSNIDPKRKWLLFGVPVCILMAFLELDRALSGNSRSWVYVMEWPFFGVFVIYMYWKVSQPQKLFDDSNDPPREID